jgi:hypothetical protein
MLGAAARMVVHPEKEAEHLPETTSTVTVVRSVRLAAAHAERVRMADWPNGRAAWTRCPT